MSNKEKSLISEVVSEVAVEQVDNCEIEEREMVQEMHVARSQGIWSEE